jgi:hypothetical protein
MELVLLSAQKETPVTKVFGTGVELDDRFSAESLIDLAVLNLQPGELRVRLPPQVQSTIGDSENSREGADEPPQAALSSNHRTRQKEYVPRLEHMLPVRARI